MSGWKAVKVTASELLAARQEFARAREQMRAGGFAADVEPDTAKRDQAVRRSADVVARLQRAERAARSPAPSAASARAAVGRWVVLAGLAAATAVVAVAVGVVAPWSTPTATAATPPLLRFSQVPAASSLDDAPPAHQVLAALAGRAAAQPALAPAGAAGYTVTSALWSLATSLDAGHPQAAVVPFQSVAHVAADGSMRRVEQRGAPLTPDGRGAAAGVEELLGPAVQTDVFPPGFVDVNLAASLPRDPVALRRALLDRRGCPDAAPTPDADPAGYGAGCLVGGVVDLYRDQLVPPDLAAALWQALGLGPSLYDAGTGEDRAGRSCVAVALEATSSQDGGRTEQWLVLADPVTGAYLGVEHVLVAGSVDGAESVDDLRAPVVLQFTTLVSTR